MRDHNPQKPSTSRKEIIPIILPCNFLCTSSCAQGLWNFPLNHFGRIQTLSSRDIAHQSCQSAPESLELQTPLDLRFGLSRAPKIELWICHHVTPDLAIPTADNFIRSLTSSAKWSRKKPGLIVSRDCNNGGQIDLTWTAASHGSPQGRSVRAMGEDAELAWFGGDKERQDIKKNDAGTRYVQCREWRFGPNARNWAKNNLWQTLKLFWIKCSLEKHNCI